MTSAPNVEPLFSGALRHVRPRPDGALEACFERPPGCVFVALWPQTRLGARARLELLAPGGARPLGYHEKQRVALEVDRSASSHALGPLGERLARAFLSALLADPSLDPARCAPNSLLDEALRSGAIASILRGRRRARGRIVPVDTITVRLGKGVELTLTRELDETGKTHLTKQLADGEQVPLSIEERIALEARMRERSRLRV